MTGNRVKRIVVADGTITEFDDTTYSAGDAIGYGVTMSANPSDLINGSTSVEYIANVATASLTQVIPPRAPSGGRTPLKGHAYGSQAAAGPQDTENQPRTVEAMGVTVTVGPAIFDDLDMVEYLYDLQTAQTGDGSGAFAIVPFLKKLCGDQYTAMKDALRDPTPGA